MLSQTNGWRGRDDDGEDADEGKRGRRAVRDSEGERSLHKERAKPGSVTVELEGPTAYSECESYSKRHLDACHGL